jgi:glycosyltransferase involved in cell wall biosynthesis
MVSVIICAFNYGRFVCEAIDSVLRQSFPLSDIEIIIVDDGSTDDTKQQVKSYGDRVKYLYKANGGQASAFNIGFREAAGEFIALLDADDFWLPDKLEKSLPAFSRFGADLVGHNLFVLDQSSMSKLFFPFKSSGWIENTFPPTSGICFRRSVLKVLSPIPERFRISADFFIIWLSTITRKRVVFDCEPLGVYRIHEDNLYVGRATRERMQRQIETFHNMLTCLQDSELLHMHETVYVDAKSELESSKEYMQAAIDEVSIRMQIGIWKKLKRLWEVALSRPQRNSSLLKFLLVAILSEASYEQLKRAYSNYLHRRTKILARA